jgi:hypothetical protein
MWIVPFVSIPSCDPMPLRLPFPAFPLLCALLAADVSAQRLPISFGAPQVVGEDAELGSIIAAQATPDGGVVAVDHVNARIVAFDPEGRPRWSAGGRGRGPAEFQTPYRVDVRRDGSVLVYDLGTSEITELSAAGAYRSRWRMPFPLTQVDALVAAGDALLVSGTTTHPDGMRHGIHRFEVDGPALRHTGSFGPLPPVRDPAVLQAWGAGPLVRGSTGSVWYTRRIPYEVYRFDAAGRQRALIRPPFGTRGTPDDAIRVEREGRSTSFSSTGARVEIPGPAWELPGGLLLVSRIAPGERHWDLFTVAGGRYRGSFPLPAEWEAIAGYDAARRTLWVIGTRADVPVLYRVPLVLPPAPPRSR